MKYRDIDFDGIAEEVGLDSVAAGHFVEGMKGDADQLPLERDAYTLLQTVLEREVMKAASPDEVPQSHAERPFAYATPNPLTPLYTFSHPRWQVVRTMFSRLMAVSVMGDPGLVSTTDKNMDAAFNVSSLAREAFERGAELFSTTHIPDDVQPPCMTMHLERESGSVRVAFVAEQLPSKTAGRLVFGDEATAMYRAVQAVHQKNVLEGRGNEYVFVTIRGELLSQSIPRPRHILH